MSKPTIYEVLKAKLGREPTHRELCDDVKRILFDTPPYDPVAVNKAIASSNRSGRRIGGREASLIHRVLKGRG